MPFLTMIVRALWDMGITVLLLLMGHGFSGGHDDTHGGFGLDGTPTDDGLGPYYNEMSGEWDIDGPPRGL